MALFREIPSKTEKYFASGINFRCINKQDAGPESKTDFVL
jgi:hypothetical protein